MSLYTEAVNALEILDNGSSITNAVDAYVKSDNPADMAASGVITAEISIGFLARLGWADAGSPTLFIE